MSFLFASMALVLAGPFAPSLADPTACRAYLRKQGYGVDKLPDDILADIIARAKEYRRTA